MGYVACLPHQGTRFAVIETTTVPAKLGRRRYHIKRAVGNFCGAGAQKRADAQCARLTHGSDDRRNRLSPTDGRKVWGRSLTIREYDSLMEREREEGSF